MINSSPEGSRQFLELLDQQFALVEEYANAKTLLYNASTKTESATSNPFTIDELGPSQPPIIVALERLEEVQRNLRANIQELTRLSAGGRQQQLRPNHLALSKRVITTIANNPAHHSNGLPNDAGRNNFAQKALEANTVAIAALKASIARIKDIERSL